MPNSKAETGAVLMNVSGRDRPGITAGLSRILAQHDVSILDIDQAVIHDNLTLGMLVKLPAQRASEDAMFRELLFTSHELDLDIRFSPISTSAYEQWVNAGGQQRCIITLLARRIGADHISAVAELVSKQDWNIASIQRVSPRGVQHENSGAVVAVELNVRSQAGNIASLQTDCLRLSSTLDADIAVQEDDIWRRNRRLVCFDMDSTLVQGEAIDLMAEAAGVGADVSAITAQAMNGEIDFRTSFERRMALLAGLPESDLESVDRKLPITDGAERLISNLKRIGYRTAILSGGFTWFARRLQQRLGIDTVHANELEIVDGKLTGRVIGDIMDEQGKATRMAELARVEGVSLKQVIAVGDGANDIAMLSKAGLGIAFHAKPAVRERAQHAFGTVGLDGILYLIGLREREIEAGH